MTTNTQKWEPPIDTETAVDLVWSQLTREDIAYAGDPARGEYRGFAALHDLCDANMLLYDAENFDASDEYLAVWHNTVMDKVSERLIARWEEWNALAQETSRAELKHLSLHRK